MSDYKKELLNFYKFSLKNIAMSRFSHVDYKVLNSMIKEDVEFEIAKELIVELSKALSTASKKLNADYSITNLEAKAFCLNFTDCFKNNKSITRDEFSYFFKVSSFELLPYILLNPSLPVDLFIIKIFDETFRSSSTFKRFSNDFENAVHARKKEIVGYYRTELKANGMPKVDVLNDEIVLKINGVDI